MSLRFIYGRAGSGKSTWCIDNIKSEIERGSNSPLILIVPEQFSFQAEKRVLERLGEKGAFRVQVLSFSRMAEKVFNEVGGIVRRHMNNAGRSMLIYSVLESNSDKLHIFKKASRKQGFAASISDMITEFKRYNITPEAIIENIEALGDMSLKNKMEDLYLIFSSFEEKLHEKYIDSEDDLTILAAKLHASKVFDGATIWIDEFASFTPQELVIITRLFDKARKINITLCSDGDNEELFLTVKNTEDKLNRIIQEKGIKYEKPVMLSRESRRLQHNAELNHLEQHLFSYPYKTYNKKTERLSIFRALNSYSEVEETAREIIRLCRDKGIKYRDIAVVSGDLDSYESLIRAVFSQYGISYFIDKKSNIINSPLIVLITSALEIVTKNWSYEAVFRYIKSGLLKLDQEEVDLLENYVLANGIRGKGWTDQEPWDRPLNYDYNNEEISEQEAQYIERVNNIRYQAASPIIRFAVRVKGKKTVRELTEALYDFLCDIDIPETLNLLLEAFEQQEQLDRAAEYRQVWDIIMELLDQVVEVMGEEILPLEEYSKILSAGFQEYEIGIIPPALDQVLVGSIQRLKSHEISVLFILGANDGVFPAAAVNPGVLTDEDRIALTAGGLEVMRDSKSQAFEEQFLTYSTLTRANEYLRLSFPVSDFEGKSKRPSIIMSRLKKIFPKISEHSDIIKDTSEEARLNNITARQPVLNDLMVEMCSASDSEVLKSIVKWYRSNEAWSPKLVNAANGFYYSNSAKIKDPEKIRDIYGKKLSISVSRLEKYVECPFSYFVQYGLKARERRIYKLSPPDLGSLMHESLYNFSGRLKEAGVTWRDMDPGWAEEKIAEIVDEMVDSSQGSIFKSSKRYQYIEENVKNTLKRSIKLIAEHIKRGGFVPEGYELNFGYDGQYPPITVELDSGEEVSLIGKIDRVDTLSKNGETYIRIVDYKSGNKEFKISDVYYGLQLQLLIYLDAILTEIGRKVQEKVLPAGVLYFKLDDPMIKTEGEMDEVKIQAAIMKALKMNGLILKNLEIISSMDSNIGEDNPGASDIIPASVNKDNSISSRSSCADIAQFDLLRSYVRDTMKKICRRILEGSIEISPYKKKNATPCQYCTYSSICQFDAGIKGNRYRILKEKKEEELWKLIEAEAGSN